MRTTVRSSSAIVASTATLLATLILGTSPADAAKPPPSPTGEGIGDPYYPDDGNLGYDVADYSVALTYQPTGSTITARTTIMATAKAALSRFDLDLVGLTVDSVNVNGAAATFTRSAAHELVITPAATVANGASFTVVVDYHGHPGTDPLDASSGWHTLTNGAGLVAGEPHSCTVWFPCNDHPTDKATFHLQATAPDPLAVVSVGVEGPTSTSTGPGGEALTTYRWNLDEPTTTYLTTLLIDRLTVRRSTLSDGTPVVDAYGPGALGAETNEARLPEILDFLATKFGPYPAPAAGGIFLGTSIGYSLETFTRPVYTSGVGLGTIVHENAHQWWGDNVAIERWRDICLNECFASYAQWLWDEHNGVDLDARYKAGISKSLFRAPLYDMGAGNEFNGAGVYTKGKYFLHALRRKLGDPAYFSALRGIQTDFGGGNIGMLKLRDEISSRSGVDLTSFWSEWVLSTRQPSQANLYPGSLG